MLNNTTDTTPPYPSSEISHDEVREELARVLASDLFLKSPQLSRFLRFCVDETLAGQQECLKEQVLGTDVFRRPSPFDPRLDPIVRVEARRLRSKLDQYYSGEGASDPVIISLQRGDYTPRFIRATPSDGRIPPARTARIVVVEDEHLVARDLETRLKSFGYQVVGSAATGEAALQQVNELKPDMVLMDIVLAGAMRGTEVARRIWSEWRIPVVYLTAFSDALILEDVKGSEPYGYILKPFDSKQLHAVLQLAISRRDRESATEAPPNSDGLLTALSSAGIAHWDWRVRDASLPWPDCVQGEGELTPEHFLARISPADRERVQEAFTEAIRTGSSLDVAYRRISEKNGEDWVVATGSVARNEVGDPHCKGVEIAATSDVRPDQANRISDPE
jgi:CheY-like chemotaxis protein